MTSAGDVEQRFRVVEDDAHACVDEIVGHLLRGAGGHGEHADDDVLLANDVFQAPFVVDRRRPELASDLRFVLIEHRGDVDPVLGEDRGAGDRLTQSPRPDERDVVLTLGAEDLADLSEQRVDRVTDPALAELAEVREIAPDLRRVDVRVVGDLLRGDALLPHLARLREHLEIARKPGGDTDREAVRGAARHRGLQHHEHCARRLSTYRTVVTSPDFVTAFRGTQPRRRSRRRLAGRRSRRQAATRGRRPRAPPLP